MTHYFEAEIKTAKRRHNLKCSECGRPIKRGHKFSEQVYIDGGWGRVKLCWPCHRWQDEYFYITKEEIAWWGDVKYFRRDELTRLRNDRKR